MMRFFICVVILLAILIPAWSQENLISRVKQLEEENRRLQTELMILKAKEAESLELRLLSLQLAQLQREVQSLRAMQESFQHSLTSSKIVGVTIHRNSKRIVMPMATSIEMETFIVDKKSATSTLLIQGTISGFGAYAGSSQQGWTYGSSAEVFAQSLIYAVSADSKLQSSSAVIENHTTTGPQMMKFRYFSQNGTTDTKPFNVYNPDTNDDVRLKPTCSVYVVWEIEK